MIPTVGIRSARTGDPDASSFCRLSVALDGTGSHPAAWREAYAPSLDNSPTASLLDGGAADSLDHDGNRLDCVATVPKTIPFGALRLGVTSQIGRPDPHSVGSVMSAAIKPC